MLRVEYVKAGFGSIPQPSIPIELECINFPIYLFASMSMTSKSVEPRAFPHIINPLGVNMVKGAIDY